MEITIENKELINWLTAVDDEKILSEVSQIKRKATFNFDEEFTKGMTSDEFKAEMRKRIQNYPSRKLLFTEIM